MFAFKVDLDFQYDPVLRFFVLVYPLSTISSIKYYLPISRALLEILLFNNLLIFNNLLYLRVITSSLHAVIQKDPFLLIFCFYKIAFQYYVAK